MGTRRTTTALAALALLLTGCGADRAAPAPARSAVPTSSPSPTATPEPELMPDLVGLGSAVAGSRIGRLQGRSDLRLRVSWEEPVRGGCDARPGTVARQVPAPGAVLERGTAVRIRTAALDLDRFRGPCPGGDLGPLTGPDADLARAFYRFAADPSRGAPFVAGDVWVGIEAGPLATTLGRTDRADPAAWELDGGYAERSGPFSVLDVLAASGGWYELHRGIVPTCPSGDATPPPQLAALRAITLTSAADTTGSCQEVWGVTLFLDADRIAAVALRLGSP